MLTLNETDITQTKVQTRDGRVARIVGRMRNTCYPLIAVFETKSGTQGETVGTYTLQGWKHMDQESPEDIMDLGSPVPTLETLVLDSVDPRNTKVTTRDGRRARILCVDLKGRKHKLVAAVMSKDGGKEQLILFHNTGRAQEQYQSSIDLVNAK